MACLPPFLEASLPARRSLVTALPSQTESAFWPYFWTTNQCFVCTELRAFDRARQHGVKSKKRHVGALAEHAHSWVTQNSSPSLWSDRLLA